MATPVSLSTSLFKIVITSYDYVIMLQLVALGLFFQASHRHFSERGGHYGPTRRNYFSHCYESLKNDANLRGVDVKVRISQWMTKSFSFKL